MARTIETPRDLIFGLLALEAGRVNHDQLAEALIAWTRAGRKTLAEILVERESQKGIVIGHRGAVLKQVGTAVRRQLPEGAYLELHVSVDKDWQRRPGSLDRLGF